MRKAAPTRAQIKNRILKEFFVTLFQSLVPRGKSGKAAEMKKMMAPTPPLRKNNKSGYNSKGKAGGSRAVAAAALTPASSCYASEGNLDA